MCEKIVEQIFNSLTNSFEMNEQVYQAFVNKTLPEFDHVQIRPKSGFWYFLVKDKSKLTWRDWVADGYRWKANGTVSFSHGGETCKNFYYKLLVEEEEKGVKKKKYTTEFSRRVVTFESDPSRALIYYLGNDSVVVDLPHGNAKHSAKTSKVFYRTDPNLQAKMKESVGKAPVLVYSEMLESAPQQIERHVVDAPRDVQQIRNMQQLEKVSKCISRDSNYNLHVLHKELKFIHVAITIPDLTLICYSDVTLARFKSLLNRSDLPAQSLAYDTTFDLGDFYLSVLTFRDTEFEESPVVPLVYMFHERKLQSVHNFVFSTFAELVPEIKDMSKWLIVTDEEKAN